MCVFIWFRYQADARCEVLAFTFGEEIVVHPSAINHQATVHGCFLFWFFWVRFSMRKERTGSGRAVSCDRDEIDVAFHIPRSVHCSSGDRKRSSGWTSGWTSGWVGWESGIPIHWLGAVAASSANVARRTARLDANDSRIINELVAGADQSRKAR